MLPVLEENYIRKATVIKVIDGDTIDLKVDLGFSTFKEDRFRLTGINSPEKNTEEGMVAKRWMESMLPIGKELVVATSKDKKEKYGRYLAVLYVKGMDESINSALIRGGMAKAYFGSNKT
jgi:micrococcal nuclease